MQMLAVELLAMKEAGMLAVKKVAKGNTEKRNYGSRNILALDKTQQINKMVMMELVNIVIVANINNCIAMLIDSN